MKLLEDTIKAQNLQDVVKVGLYMNGDDLYHDDVGKYEIENPQPKSWLDENQVVCITFIVIHQLTLTRSISISNWSLIIQVALLGFYLFY